MSMSSRGRSGDRAEPENASDWWRAEEASRQTWPQASDYGSAPPSDVSPSPDDLHTHTTVRNGPLVFLHQQLN